MLESELKLVDETIGKLAAPAAEGLGYRGSSRIAEKLSGLFASIQGVNAAPTPAQIEAFAELQPEVATALADAEKVINERLKKLNELLRKNDAPTLIIGRMK
jgi:prephenate dehydrogenase